MNNAGYEEKEQSKYDYNQGKLILVISSNVSYAVVLSILNKVLVEKTIYLWQNFNR